MEVGGHRGIVANEHIRIGGISYEKVNNFKNLGSLLAYQNSIHKNLKCRLNYYYYFSVGILQQNLVLLSEQQVQYSEEKTYLVVKKTNVGNHEIEVRNRNKNKRQNKLLIMNGFL